MRKKANTRSVLLASMLVATLVFAGCKKKEEPSSSPQPKPGNKAHKAVQNQATSAKIAGTEQSLDFSGKKDPFKPYAAMVVPQEKPKPAVVARTRELLPIQSYDVTKFTVSGIIAGLKENTALVIDPAGKGYVVKEGMLIGNNDGRISRITPSSIEVAETYRDDNGRLKKRTIVLTLSKKR